MAQEIYHRSEWGNPTEQWGNVYLNPDLTNELYKRASEYENSWVTDQLLNGVGTKPSIILTPTAYEDGVLNSVKPQRTLGNELVTNGTFDTDTDWTKQGFVTISSGSANFVDGGGNPYSFIRQNISQIFGKKYLLKFEIKNYVSGALQIIFQNGGIANTYNANGVYYIDIESTTTNGYVEFSRNFTAGSFSFSIDNVSVKEVTDADFDFTRGSSATRVNELGLVQDVQLLSGELVQNGNFEQIGAEEVTNGNFDSDSGWTKTSTVTISNGVANIVSDGSYQYLAQSNITTQNKFYKLVYTIVSNNNGALKFSNGSGSYGNLTSTVGTHIKYFQANTGSSVYIERQSGVTDISIDNVSVKEVGQNWTFLGDFETDGTKAFITNASQYSQLTNQIGVNYLLSGNKYRLTFDIPTLSISGAFAYRYTGGSVTPILTTDIENGKFTTEFIMPSNGYFWLQTTGSYTGLNVELDNVSVIEITDDTDLPRINYKDGEGSLLLEPQSTNLITYSEDFTQWTRNTTNIDTPSNVTQTNPSGESESGFININNGVSATKFIYKSISTTSSIHTQSVFFKYHSRQWVQLLSGGTTHYANFDIQNGVVGNILGCTATIEDYGSGWYKCTATLSSASTPTNMVIAVLDDDATSRLPNSTGTGSYYVWGTQTEALSYATSYIPTNGSTVTRLADVCNNSGSSDLINSTEGVLYVEALLKDTGTFKTVARITATDTSTSDGLWIYFRSDNKIQSVLRVGGVDQASILSNTQTTDEYYKVAFKFKQNDFALWVNGTEVATDTSGNTFSADTLSKLGFILSTDINPFIGNVKCLAVFKEALSDEELQKLTQV